MDETNNSTKKNQKLILAEIREELEKIEKNSDKMLISKLKREIRVQFEISGNEEGNWAVMINNKELKIVRKSIEKPNIKFTFKTAEGFLKYLKKEIPELRGWMNEYYLLEGPPGILATYYNIIGYEIPSQWHPNI